jgi:isopropylmalate/homocitrate/citramalate synthase
VSLFLLKPLHLFQKHIEISNIHFDFHAHNDYDLSIANVMEAIKAGIKAYVTVNGMGNELETHRLKVPLR